MAKTTTRKPAKSKTAPAKRATPRKRSVKDSEQSINEAIKFHANENPKLGRQAVAKLQVNAVRGHSDGKCMELMLDGLKESKDKDVSDLAKKYETMPDENKVRAILHYQVNGDIFLNAVFKGKLEQAKELANKDNLECIKSIKRH